MCMDSPRDHVTFIYKQKSNTQNLKNKQTNKQKKRKKENV